MKECTSRKSIVSCHHVTEWDPSRREEENIGRMLDTTRPVISLVYSTRAVCRSQVCQRAYKGYRGQRQERGRTIPLNPVPISFVHLVGHP